MLPGFRSSQEAEVICLPMELACSEQQLPQLPFSNLPARSEVPVLSVPRPAPGQDERTGGTCRTGLGVSTLSCRRCWAPSSRGSAETLHFGAYICGWAPPGCSEGSPQGLPGVVQAFAHKIRKLLSGPAAASSGRASRGVTHPSTWGELGAAVAGRVLGLGAGFGQGDVERVLLRP